MTDERRPEMTDEQLDAQLRDILADDGTRDPARERVTASVLQGAEGTPQARRRWWRRGWRDGQRAPGMPLLAPIAIAALAVVFVGLLFLGLVGPQADEQPAASASATASPQASPLDVETGLAEIEPGFTLETVAPGIERVVADGAGFDMGALGPGEHIVFEDIDVSVEGEVWIVARRFDDDPATSDAPFAFELGSEGAYGFEAGFPSFPVKLVVDDGTAVVASTDAVHRFEDGRWVRSSESHSVSDFDGSTRFVQPEGVASLGEASVLDPGTDAVLVIHSDGLGYTLGEDVGQRLWREWPSWWEVCGPESRMPHRGGTGCRDRSVLDERGIGVGHDDASTALLLPDVITRRIARGPDQAVWVIGGPTIDDVRAGRVDTSGGIYRIDPAAPGFRCEGC